MAKKTAKKTRKKKTKLTRILSIDGGGIRGILPGQILVALEGMLQEKSGDATMRIADCFDLVAGTSTGGILACLYLCPDDSGSGRPQFTAKEAVDLYLQRGDEIFEPTLWQRIRSLGGMADEKYSAAELESALNDYFGDLKLSDLLKPCVITAYDIKRRRPYFFTQHDASLRKADDFYVKDVARATSAAPTFFEVAQVKSLTKITYPLIDGGLFANNPALCAYAEARTMKGVGRINSPRAKEMVILSLGTGEEKRSYPYKAAKDWGKLQWVQPVIDIMMSGNSETVAYQLKQIFSAIGEPQQYLRINPKLNGASPELDDASEENLNLLREAGTKSAETHRQKLEAMAELLLKHR